MRFACASLLLLVAAAFLVGCGGNVTPRAEAVPNSATPVTASPDASATARPVATGSTGVLTDCGIERLAQGAPALDGAARDCLWQAYQRQDGAVFTSIAPTIEGDPIAMHVAVLGAGDVRLEVDSTRDRFSAPADRRVHTYRCTTLSIRPGSGDLPGRFEVSGCGAVGPFVV
jgi:hypothetical protein